MKKYLILLITVLTSLHVSAQSDGFTVMAGKQYANSCQMISQVPMMQQPRLPSRSWKTNLAARDVKLKIDKSLNLGEGYNL